MKISVSLINQYLKNPISTELMAETLEKTEVEVEEILYANQLDERIITAVVKSVASHPNADKLKLAELSTGIGDVSVVCGAPNVRPGIVVALAQVGSVLPSGDVIEEAIIRGEKSHGMLCSERELGWGDDHSGIVELDPTLPFGQSLCDIAQNTDIIDIKTPSNRWDYLSYIGLAREIAANLADNALVEPENEEKTYDNREVVKVNTKNECREFIYVKMKLHNEAESPRWLVDNLQASGMRTINPVVDITNFVMLETGQPSHAYDAKKIKANLGVRFSKPGEKLDTLDGKKIALDGRDLVIVDKSGPIGLAGVMGGTATETTKETTEIILEVANFDKTTVRRSALRHGLRTEASARFERGLPLPLPYFAANRIISLLCELCSAEVVGSPIRQLYADYQPVFLGMRQRKAERFLGYKLDEKEVVRALSLRGFKPNHFSLSKEIRQLPEKQSESENDNFVEKIYSKSGVRLPKVPAELAECGMPVPAGAYKPGDLIVCTSSKDQASAELYIVSAQAKAIGYKGPLRQSVSVASLVKGANYLASRRMVENFNHIISVEVPWWRLDVSEPVDLFEEVAKAVGYEQMPATLAELGPSATAQHQLLPHFLALKNSLVAYGLIEVVTHAFIAKKDLLTSLSDENKCLQIENPLSSEQDYLRSDLLSSHLRAVEKNQDVSQNAIFEVSRVYEKAAKTPSESWRLAITVWGKDSLVRLKGVLDMVFDYYRITPAITRDLNSKRYYSTRAANIGSGFGQFGQIQDSIARGFDLAVEVSFAELDLMAMIEAMPAIKVDPPLPYRLISRDLTIEVGELTTYKEVWVCLQQISQQITYIGEYTDKVLKDKSRKRISLTVGFDLGPNPRAKQIESKLDQCIASLKKLPQAKVL